MKIGREELLAHLRMIHCGGEIPEASAFGAFGTRAVAQDNAVAVLSPGIVQEGDDPFALPTEVGVLDVDKLIKSLSAVEDPEVDVDLRDGRLVVSASRSVVALVTAAPAQITTRVTADQEAKFMSVVPDEEAARKPLSPKAVREYRKLHAVLADPKDPEAALKVRGKDLDLVVGRGTENQAAITVPDAGDGGEYVVRLVSRALLRVLYLVQGGATIQLTGPDSLVVVRRGAYTYVLSPLAAEG